MLVWWALGGLVVFAGALAYAELAVRLPESGGEFVYLDRAFGPRWAFLFGWINLVLAGPASVAAVARIFADYFGRQVVLTEMATRGVAAGLIALLTLVAVTSTRSHAAVVTAATIAKLGAIAVVLVVAFFVFGAPAGVADAPMELAAAGSHDVTFASLALALTSIIFAYKGFQTVTLVAGEVRDPQRTLPRGLLLGSGLIVGVYLLLNIAYVKVLGFEAVRGSAAVAVDTMERAVGAGGAVFVAVMVMVSTFGTVSAQILGYPRLAWSMADRGLLIPRLAKLSSRGTPAAATLVVGALSIILVLAGAFSFLTRLAVMALYPLMALTLVGAMRLRRIDGEPQGFRMPWYPVPILVFCAIVAFMTIFSAIGDPKAAAISAGALAAGALVYGMRRVRQ
jgi:APA family basic amino acid/polyamine antiporter